MGQLKMGNEGTMECSPNWLLGGRAIEYRTTNKMLLSQR